MNVMETIPTNKDEQFDLRAFMNLQADLLRSNHADWDDPSGNEVVKHAAEIEQFATDFRAYVEARPEILDAYRSAPEATVQKLKEIFYK